MKSRDTIKENEKQVIFKSIRDEIKEEIRFENEQLRKRITWLLTVQPFLMATIIALVQLNSDSENCVASLLVDKMVNIIAWVAVIICIITLGVTSFAFRARYKLDKDYKNVLKEINESRRIHDVFEIKGGNVIWYSWIIEAIIIPLSFTALWLLIPTIIHT